LQKKGVLKKERKKGRHASEVLPQTLAMVKGSLAQKKGKKRRREERGKGVEVV